MRLTLSLKYLHLYYLLLPYRRNILRLYTTPYFLLLTSYSLLTTHPEYNADRGVITGMRYVWNEDIQNWQYQYYIALNLDSPSYEWTKFDWGWQEDLEALFFPDSQTSDRTKEDND